jgi:alpha-tubulin suppressor-like RCC1 family protein
VKGEDNHVQVACGLNFTVALTNNGEVYQMGNTGAQNNREKDKADWKVGIPDWQVLLWFCERHFMSALWAQAWVHADTCPCVDV